MGFHKIPRSQSDSRFGLTGKDFVILAADGQATDAWWTCCKLLQGWNASRIQQCNTSVPSMGENKLIRLYAVAPVLIAGIWQAAYSIIRLKNDADKIWKVLQTSYFERSF